MSLTGCRVHYLTGRMEETLAGRTATEAASYSFLWGCSNMSSLLAQYVCAAGNLVCASVFNQICHFEYRVSKLFSFNATASGWGSPIIDFTLFPFSSMGVLSVISVAAELRQHRVLWKIDPSLIKLPWQVSR